MAKNKIAIAPGYTEKNKVKLIRGGRDYFTLMIEMISNAKQSIHLHVYIFDEDETGTLVADALIDAALRNVEVFILVDGFASQNLSEEFLRRFFLAGIGFRMFEPIFLTNSFYFGRRLHHKVLVTDGYRSLAGGINISNKYNDHNGNPPWLDWALYAEGEVSAELLKILVQIWTRSKYRSRKYLQKHIIHQSTDNTCLVRVRRNDWVQRKTQITASYFKMFRKARSHITIMSSYFLPGLLFRKQLERACRRGIKIKLILAGTSDVKLAKHAERYIYRWLFRHNIEIYEYNSAVLHGKIATADDEWVTIGSYNVNNISAFASIELNLDVSDKEFASTLNQHLQKITEADCKRITEKDYDTEFPFYLRLIQWMAYHTVRVLFYMFTFYFKQKA